MLGGLKGVRGRLKMIDGANVENQWGNFWLILDRLRVLIPEKHILHMSNVIKSTFGFMNPLSSYVLEAQVQA